MPNTGSSSIRRIVATTAVLGTSSVANILLATVRMKVAALLLGVAGIGMIGLLQNFMMTSAAFLGLGIGQAAPGQIGRANANGPPDEALARRAVAVATVAAAVVGAAIVWLTRDIMARELLREPSLAPALGWMAIGTALTIIAASQNALLAGLGRIGDVARLSIASGVVATIAALLCLYVWHVRAVIPFVLSAPIFTVVVGTIFTGRLPRSQHSGRSRKPLIGECASLVTVGISMMIATALVLASQFAIRALISRHYGLAELGLFQAAWAISTMYLSMVLQAMAVDYFPRLSAAAANRAEANQLINDQTAVALALAGPVILLALGLAPWGLQLLYSSEFRRATALLRWLLLSDVFRVMSWPLSYMLLAGGRKRIFLSLELAGAAVFIASAAILLPVLEIEVVGMAYAGMYVLFLPITFVVVARTSGFRWTPEVIWRFSILLVLALAVFTMSAVSDVTAAVTALVASAVLFFFWGRKMIRLVLAPDLPGPDPVL